MARWIILLRGINVGGHRKIPMADLRNALTAGGFSSVQSYIQSGNLVADFPGDARAVTAAARRIIIKRFGFDVDVLTLSTGELEQALADLPFDTRTADPARVHLFFHINPDAPVAIDDLSPGAEPAACAPGALAHYLNTPDGLSKSKLAEQVSRRMSNHATARNLRTCRKLLEMAQSK